MSALKCSLHQAIREGGAWLPLHPQEPGDPTSFWNSGAVRGLRLSMCTSTKSIILTSSAHDILGGQRFLWIHDLALLGMLPNHACLLYGENFLLPTFSRNIFKNILSLFLSLSHHLRTCEMKCLHNLVSGSRIHSLLLTVQSSPSCLSVKFEGIWASP